MGTETSPGFRRAAPRRCRAVLRMLGRGMQMLRTGADPPVDVGIRLRSQDPGAVQLSYPLLREARCRQRRGQRGLLFLWPAAETCAFLRAWLSSAGACFPPRLIFIPGVSKQHSIETAIFLGCQILSCLYSRRRRMKNFKVNAWE